MYVHECVSMSVRTWYTYMLCVPPPEDRIRDSVATYKDTIIKYINSYTNVTIVQFYKSQNTISLNLETLTARMSKLYSRYTGLALCSNVVLTD